MFPLLVRLGTQHTLQRMGFDGMSVSLGGWEFSDCPLLFRCQRLPEVSLGQTCAECAQAISPIRNQLLIAYSNTHTITYTHMYYILYNKGIQRCMKNIKVRLLYTVYSYYVYICMMYCIAYVCIHIYIYNYIIYWTSVYIYIHIYTTTWIYIYI